MHKRNRISLAAMLAVSGVGLGTAPSPVSAQQQETATVTITGSRLLRPELIGNTPVIAVGQETLGNLGIENFADMATQLPQFAPSFGSSRTQSTFSGVASSGLNLANLRNLAGVRTLVLINGRRTAGGTATSTSVDFNTIPTANIERIEITTGAASAVYGTDAVAGVINIITKRNFEGFEAGVGYGEAEAGDNENPTGHFMLGGKFGTAGRALLTLQYDRQGQVSCRNREICSEDFFWGSPATQLRGPAAYSGVGLGGRFFVGGTSYTRRNNSFTGANGALIPFNVQIDGYNRNADRDLAIPTRRIMAAGDVEYDITKNIRAFAEFNYGQTSISSDFEGHPFQSQASGSLFGNLQATIPLDNPFIPAPLLAAVNAFNATAPANQRITAMTWWQRFNTAGGPRGATSDRSTFRTTFGIKGDMPTLGGFGRDWRWEVSHVYGRTSEALNTDGLVSTSNLYYGLRVEPDPTRPGQFRCSDAGARAQGCVPINPFADYTAAQQTALRVGGQTQGRSAINDTVAYITGTLSDLPAGSLRGAVGVERRTFSGYRDYDEVINKGLATGNQIADTPFNKTSTDEVFAEVQVPVLSDKPLVESLNVEAAVRSSDSTKFSYDTWQLRGDWEVAGGLRLRASRGKAVRSPVPGELGGGGATFGVINDPCTAARRNLNPTRAANCAADGVPADYAPPVVVEQSVEGRTGGNPDLVPEEAATTTFGLVWQPKQVKGLSVTVDRFKIDIDKIITTVSRQIAVDKCYDTVERLLCNAIARGTSPLIPGANYVLASVNEQQQNVAKQDIAGVDIDVKYNLGLGGWGNLDLELLATLYDKATLVPLAGSAPIDLLGQAGGSTSDQGWIKLTAAANIGWKWNRLKVNWNIRYIGAADMAVGTTANGFPRIPAHNYHNVRVGYEFAKGSEAFVGVTNLGDKKPPFFASGTSGTQALDTVPGYYDVFGRSWFVGAKVKF
jgi:outer membrane receptor protein involved in Fe transport